MILLVSNRVRNKLMLDKHSLVKNDYSASHLVIIKSLTLRKISYE